MTLFEKVKAESWNIAYRTASEGTILDNRNEKFNVIKNPIRYWAADPFVFEKDGKTYLFAELYDYCANKGVIGCAELKEAGCVSWKVIIREKWHLSYPFVFENGEEVYIVPEMNDGNELWLYKAEVFPFVWKKEKVIMRNVRLVDATLRKVGQGYTVLSQDINQNPLAFRLDENFNFETYMDFIGNSGLVTRPGGRFFDVDKVCYAVCQDCSQTYGGALLFYEAELSCDSVVLSNIALHLLPKDLVLNHRIEVNGIHTYTATNNYEVIDLKTRRFSLLNLLGRFLAHIRR